VTNNCNEAGQVSVSAIAGPVAGDNLANALNIEIKKAATQLYSDLLADFYVSTGINLGSVGIGETAQFDLTVSFPLEKGNDWQGKATGFNLVVTTAGTGQITEEPHTFTDIGGGGAEGAAR